ncbi:MAG TPA: barstar family protein [Usitatibacter sp.]|jgi:RNAse (barnase) inhibitor barstar|nr:barstar family protein [Usitatibacter sp.]
MSVAEALESLLEDNRGGVYFVPGNPDSKALKKVAKAAGYEFFQIDGKKVTRKEQLLNAAATAMRFPGDFGHNWDALEECLVDMEWVDGDGFVFYYDHIDGLLNEHPDQFETLVEILRDAVESWKEDGEAMVAVLSGSKAPKGVGKLKAD